MKELRSGARKGGAGRFGVPLLLAGGAAALMAAPSWSARAQWSRAAPWDILTWFTAHFTHWSWNHFLWDAVVFVALAAWALRLSRPGFVATVAVAAPAILLAVWAAVPGIDTYRGLSGLDSALFGLLSALLWREAWARRDRSQAVVVALFLAGFAAKTAYEAFVGQAFFAGGEGGMVPVPMAHAVGLAVGATVGFMSGSRAAPASLASKKGSWPDT